MLKLEEGWMIEREIDHPRGSKARQLHVINPEEDEAPRRPVRDEGRMKRRRRKRRRTRSMGGKDKKR